jgi:hypothetical protein
MDDDDLPLCSLAAKAPSFDDDTPLANLAAEKKPKAVKPKEPGAGGAKAAPKRAAPKKRSKSNSSSSSSSSSSSDSSVKPRKKKAGSTNLAQKKKALQHGGTEDFEDGGGAVKKKDKSAREQVVADLLSRWWYAMDDWPPQDEAFYKPLLEAQKLRKVEIEEWEWVPETDADTGRRKVYELKQFRGLFRDSAGGLHDLRPMDTCPCYATFIKKDMGTLYNLLIKAIEGQLEDLKNSKYNEKQLEAKLQSQMVQARKKASDVRQLDGGAAKKQKSGS